MRTSLCESCWRVSIESYIEFTKIELMWWLWFTRPDECREGCEGLNKLIMSRVTSNLEDIDYGA